MVDVTDPKGMCNGCDIEYTAGNYFSGNTTYLKLCHDEECLNQIETFRLNVVQDEFIYVHFAPLNYQNTIANPRVMPKSVGCYYDYGPGYEDPLEESICNITSSIYGNGGSHQNMHSNATATHHSTGGGICTCEDGHTYLVGEVTSGKLACVDGHDGGVTIPGSGEHTAMVVLCKERPAYIKGYMAKINAKLMSKVYAKRLKIIIKMYYDADQEVFLPKGDENSINLSFSL